MSNNQKFINELNVLKKQYNGTITELSKSNNETFIIDNTLLFSGDKFKSYFENIEYASVDAIDYYLCKNKLIINFFEFKNMDLDNEDNSIKTDLIELTKYLEKCDYGCDFYNSFSELCTKLPNDKILQLKIKGLETLIMLYSYFKDFHYELFNSEKRYYVVSQVSTSYPKSPNKSNRRKGDLRKRYDPLLKIQPFPFVNVQSINVLTFKKIVHNNSN